MKKKDLSPLRFDSVSCDWTVPNNTTDEILWCTGKKKKKKKTVVSFSTCLPL